MTPKSCKYVDQNKQDNLTCKHENTCKSMEFVTLWKYFWSLTVYLLYTFYKNQAAKMPGSERVQVAKELVANRSGSEHV